MPATATAYQALLDAPLPRLHVLAQPLHVLAARLVEDGVEGNLLRRLQLGLKHLGHARSAQLALGLGLPGGGAREEAEGTGGEGRGREGGGGEGRVEE